MKPVQLSGASWRLPGSSALSEMESDPRGVRNLLDSLGSAREPIPLTRWSPESLKAALTGTAGSALESITKRCSYGGFVRGLGALDYAYFGLSKNEAQLCDPQQRMLLEHVTAALAVSANTHPREKVKAPEDGGVFIGISFNDWANLTMWNASTPHMRKSVFASSGSFTSYASGRLSFALGMRGPCVSINTACSSGLVALHGARGAVATGETSTSIAACTNAILEPTISINFAVKGITSPRGRCHTFDASADGYMRSEACVVFALTALDDNDNNDAINVEDVIVRHDGKSASLTAPNGTAQIGMLAATSSWRDAYEAHGTATPLGDPIEVGALARYVAQYPSIIRDMGDSSLALSGAKCAYGHGEAVAGAIGLLVSLLALRRGDAAPNGALCKINPSVAADRGQILVLPPIDALPIENSSTLARAIGVSSLGASGTIAHAVVSGSRPLTYDKDTLCKSWPHFPNRVELPWAPWTPPEIVNEKNDSPSNKVENNFDDVVQAVRAVVTPLIGTGNSLDETKPLLDQGIDSLVALELVAELQAKFPDANLPQTLLVDCPSIDAIAETVVACTETSQAQPVTTFDHAWQNTEGEDGPTVVVKKIFSSIEKPLEAGEQIFFVHGVDGDPLAMLFQQIAAELRFPSSTVRCIEKPKSECFCVEELAAYYVARIKERQPNGKYRLFGHSFGALLAHQMAVQLERNGDQVAALILGDFEVTYPPSRNGQDIDNVGRFGLEEWEGGEIESIKLACRRFGSMASAGQAFDPDAFRAKVLTNAHSKTERRMRAMFHYMPGYMQRREWDRLLDLWERNMEFLYTVTVPKFGPKRRDLWQPDGVVKGPTLHLRAAGSNEFAAAEHINARYCSNFTVKSLDGLHYTFLQKPHAIAVAKAIDDFISSKPITQVPNLNSVVETQASTILATPTASIIVEDNLSQVDTELSLAGLVARRADELKDKSFVLSWERKHGVVETLSYAEFAARCAATASRLTVIVKGRATAMLVHATVPAHIVIVALSALGQAAVLLNPRLRAEVLATLLSKLEESCGCLVTGLSFRALAARVAPAVNSLINAKTALLLGINDIDLHLDTTHECLLPTGATSKVPPKGWWVPKSDHETTENEQGTVIMFTSGTTGAPKPMIISSKMLLKSAHRMWRYESQRGLTGDSGTLSFLPLFHMMGLAHNFCLNLLSSGKLLVHAAAASMPLTLGLLLEAAPTLQPSQLESVAVTAEQLSEMLSVGGEIARDIRSRLGSVKCFKIGGSKLSRRVVDTLASASLPVLEHYGSTELCGYVLAALTPSKNKKKQQSLQNGMESVDMEPIDSSLNAFLRTGDQTEGIGGELIVATSPGTQHATGDIFVETARNKFTFRSRVDGMLVLGSGEMVEPTAIEATVLLELARSVKRCCLCGNGLRRPALLLELRSPPDDTTTLAAITATVDCLNERCLEDATKLLHTHVLLIDDIQLPTTLKGAVDRSAAQAIFQTDLDAAEAGCLVHHSLQAYNLGYGPKE
uniref:Carrier domain-containing protein n=1 Tax=Aureoumbra lagunensis TaxID=44058 RepID=A0A7S3NH73_9STRA